MKLSKGFLLLAFGLMSSVVLAQDNRLLTAYVGAMLIDVTSNVSISNSAILIEGNRIKLVGERDKVPIPDGVRTIDVRGKWITPGLVDAHSHFFESGQIYPMLRRMSYTDVVSFDKEVAWMRARLPVTLESFVCAGVTSTISAGGPKFEYDARKMAERALRAPNVFVAHGPISAAPSEMIFSSFEGDTPVRTASSPEQAVARVREGRGWGADLIKTGYLGGPFAEMEKNYVALLDAIIAESHRLGFPVTMHVKEVEPARSFVLAGVDSLQHTPSDTQIDDTFVELMLKKKTMIVPTLAVYRRLTLELPTQSIKLLPIEKRCGDPEVIETFTTANIPELSREKLAKVNANLNMAKENAAKLYRAGVPIATGSDAGVPGVLHGPTLHYELKLLSEIGMSNQDIIKAATLNAARVAGKDDLVGSIEAGKLADFLILRADPLKDISNLQEIETVVKDGIALDQDDLLPPDHLRNYKSFIGRHAVQRNELPDKWD